jgi:drug/metabolite transporter (DMT)-like permease
LAALSREHVAELALVGVAAVWGLTFPVVQDAVAVVPVMTFLAFRFLLAAVVVALVAVRPLGALSPAGLLYGVILGAFLTAGYVFQTLGLERTSASNAGFITGMFVVLTPILGAVIFRHRAGRTAWIAAAVSAMGLVLLSGVGGDESSAAGDGLVFLCACSFALHILFSDRAVKGHAVIGLLVIQLAVCGIFSLIVAFATDGVEFPDDESVWMAIAITAFVASAIGFFVQLYAQRHASPARTALILASEPAFAGLFAYLIKGETLSLVNWAGALLILGAIVVVELAPYLRPPRPLPEG